MTHVAGAEDGIAGTAHIKADELNIIAAAEYEELKPNILAEADNTHALPKPKILAKADEIHLDILGAKSILATTIWSYFLSLSKNDNCP